MNTGMSRNGALLLGVILLVVVVVGVLSYDKNPKPADKIGNSVSDVLNSADKGLKEFQEEVKDEIDDNTTNAQ